MDWGMDWLRQLTIEVEFQRGGKTQYIVPTWAGVSHKQALPYIAGH
jgi:hypothetical protein